MQCKRWSHRPAQFFQSTLRTARYGTFVVIFWSSKAISASAIWFSSVCCISNSARGRYRSRPRRLNRTSVSDRLFFGSARFTRDPAAFYPVHPKTALPVRHSSGKVTSSVSALVVGGVSTVLAVLFLRGCFGAPGTRPGLSSRRLRCFFCLPSRRALSVFRGAARASQLYLPDHQPQGRLPLPSACRLRSLTLSFSEVPARLAGRSSARRPPPFGDTGSSSLLKNSCLSKS